ncbi:MAG TPA: DUF2225 domain-containing protein [Candidatus Hydrogenedentes bacterium]|nr:DUF2225 domain-containing protein [Candidatus Hydrogenedentota bacterium]HQM49329.1 DUF2225 domain-containing protein [Candidatus Hydrogenedentota bacterium]
MPSKQSPFVHKAIACPACHTKTEHRFFRQRVFLAEEAEPDQHVIRYKWASGDVQRVNPLYYALYFCPQCFYADVAEEFGKPFESESGMAAVKAFTKAISKDTLLQLVGEHIDYEDIDFEVALRLHFMAILIQSLVEKELQDPYKLARLYLRLAWLYREQQHGLPQGIDEPRTDAVNAPAVREETSAAPELLAAADAMQKACGQFDAHWRALERLANQRARELSGTASAAPHNPYPYCIETLMSAYEQLGQGLQELRDLAVRDVSGLLHDAREDAILAQSPNKPNEPGTPSRRRAHFLPHAVFMERLAQLWKEAPLNEQDALTQALEQFRRALANDLRLENPQSRLKISSLVVELQMRQGDFRGALEVTRQLHRLAMTSRQNLQAQLREEDITESDARRIHNLIQKTTLTLENAADLREDIIRRMVIADMPRIRKAFATLSARARLKDFEDALTSHGVAKEIITYLKKRNMQLPAV